MSIKSSKIRNNISLLLMTTLLNGFVINDGKAIDGGSYAAQLGLKKRLEDAKKAASSSDESPYMFHDTTSDPETEKKEHDELRIEAEKQRSKKLENDEKARNNSRAGVDDEEKKLKAARARTAEKEAIENRKNRDADEGLSQLMSDKNKNEKIPSITEESFKGSKTEETVSKFNSDTKDPSKLRKLTSKISDIRERSGIPGSIKEARNNAKENFSNLKKGTTKAAKNVRDAAKSAHESISNKINPKISPEEAAKLKDEQNVKALNAHKEMADKANAKGAHEEMVRRANKDDVKKPTPLSTSEAVKSTESAGETKTAAPKKQGFFSKIFGGSKPKPTVPTSDLDSAASKASKFEEAASFVERL